MTVFVTVVWGAVNSGPIRFPFPTGWRIPFYNDGRARITAGPGEGGHTGASAKAIDFVAMDTWASTKDVRSTSPGTVKIAANYVCAGRTVAIEDSNKNASFYYHLESWSVSVGQPVARGQVIGKWDNTTGGDPTCSTGPHLHFAGRNSVNWSLPLSSGTPLNIKDLRFVGWYPWWPNPNRDSGFVVQSTSHNVTWCTTDRTIDVRWPPASSIIGGSNIDGYSWAWTTSSTTIPDNTKEAEETVSSTTSTPLAYGTWWFHLKVRDNAGNWTKDSEVAHSGPLCISSIPAGFEGIE
jgi:murein DD-endopeptidase MepM/ murein hydrolase activator NlpD